VTKYIDLMAGVPQIADDFAASHQWAAVGQLRKKKFQQFPFPPRPAAGRSRTTLPGNPTQRLVGVQVKIELDLQVCDPPQKRRRKTKSAIS
jgi:hypothetical protein